MYKKVAIFILVILIIGLVGCKKDKETIRVIVPNGTPLIAIAGVENDKVISENVSGPSSLIAAMTAKTHDIIIAPITTGAKLYIEEASKYKLDSIITFSNLYLVSNKPLDNIIDLDGKKIVGYGQGTTPGIILEKSLEHIETDILYVSSVSDAASYLINQNDEYDYVLLSEPVLSNTYSHFNNKLYIIDLGELLKDELPMIPQAGIFVNPESLNSTLIIEYIKQVKENIININTNPESYAKKIESKNEWLRSMTEERIKLSIPKSNIDFIKANNNNDLKIFFDFLNETNKDILSGAVDENYYYK